MKRAFPQSFLFLVLSFLLLNLTSCGQKTPEPPKPAEPAEAEVLETERKPVELPSLYEGLVTYAAGEVTLQRGGEDLFLEIGDIVTSKDIIITASDGICEIQFLDLAVIRMQENTSLVMAKLDFASTNRSLNVEMAAGSVLVKVQRLIGRDNVSVSTESVVCGVRGTEFSVKSSAQGKTVLSVKKGSVAVLPAALAPSVLLGDAEDPEGALADLIEEVSLNTAVLVQADQELSVTQETAEAVRPAAEAAAQLVRKVIREQVVRPEAVKEINNAFAASVKTAAQKIEPPVELPPESREALRALDQVVLLPIPPAAAPDQPAPKLVGVSVIPEPQDALITVNGQPVGRGTFSRVYPQGEVLRFVLQREGYHTHEFTLDTAAGGRDISVKLREVPRAPAEQPKEIQFSVSPPDTVVFINGSRAGTGEFSQNYPLGTVLDITAEKEGYSPFKETLRIQESTPARYSISLIELPAETPEETAAQPALKEPASVRISVVPADAQITVNNAPAVRGEYRGDFLEGDTLAVSAARSGFEPLARQMTLRKGENTLSLELKPRPVEHTASLAGQPLVNSLITEGGTLYAADKAGRLFAVSSGGRVLWSTETSNSPNENSIPVLAGGRLYFSGSRELIIADPRTGKISARVPLSGDNSHMFGRRVVLMSGNLLMPTDKGYDIIDPATGAARSSVTLPEGTQMTPAVWQDKVVIANQKGSLFVISSADGTAEREIESEALQPLAHAALVQGGGAVFAGRRGNVVCTDLAKGTLRWERKLPDGSQVITDPLGGDRGVYLLARNTLFALDWASGKDLFPPVSGVSAPPALIGGQLVYPTQDGRLVFADPATGAPKRVLVLPDKMVGTARPAAAGGLIGLGTRDGKILLINPEGVR